MSLLLGSIGFGLVTAAVLAIAAVGFTMQFAVTDVLNLAYSGVMIVSAYAAYAVNNAGASIWFGIVAAVIAGALLSVILNKFIYTPFQRRGTTGVTMVIVTLGITLILTFGLQAVVGGTNVSYNMSQPASSNFAGLQLTWVQVTIIAASLVVMAGIHGLLRYTKLGKAMRATAANRPLARNSGIRTERVVTATWAITGGLCGLSGTIFAIDAGSFGATSTQLFLVLILAAVFLGGPGQPYGAMLGALIIGLATEVSANYIASDYKDVIAFLLLFAMLAWRPSGLLGART